LTYAHYSHLLDAVGGALRLIVAMSFGHGRLCGEGYKVIDRSLLYWMPTSTTHLRGRSADINMLTASMLSTAYQRSNMSPSSEASISALAFELCNEERIARPTGRLISADHNEHVGFMSFKRLPPGVIGIPHDADRKYE